MRICSKIPAVPPAPVALVTSNAKEVPGDVVKALCAIAQPVDSIFLVISEIRSPLILSLKVAVIRLVTDGEEVGDKAVLFPPERICDEVKVTVGRVASITTFASAVEPTVVVPPRVWVATIEYVPSSMVANVHELVVD